MSQNICVFADRISNISVTGPLVRIEFCTLAPPASEGGKPQVLPGQTVVMPLDGFAASVGMLDAMVKKLIADGVLKPRPGGAPPPADSSATIQ